jgi:DNA-binding transcriptional MocR family regulator
MRVPKAAEVVAANLRRQIVLGEVAAGDYLPSQAQLMRRFGVSRPTLREALAHMRGRIIGPHPLGSTPREPSNGSRNSGSRTVCRSAVADGRRHAEEWEILG